MYSTLLSSNYKTATNLLFSITVARRKKNFKTFIEQQIIDTTFAVVENRH